MAIASFSLDVPVLGCCSARTLELYTRSGYPISGKEHMQDVEPITCQYQLDWMV